LPVFQIIIANFIQSAENERKKPRSDWCTVRC